MSNSVIESMLSKYELTSDYAKTNAMKEIMQEIVLCGLSRAGFFQQAAFYGGTALRIFYGLDRFSEDLDFSLMASDPDFDLQKYFPALQREVASYGMNVEISEKRKSKDSAVKSHLLLFYDDQNLLGTAKPNEVLKIKFEVDTEPPKGATFERKFRLLPAPFEVNLYDESSLFAGKIHAVICRAWKNRVKGRDLYDYVFYLGRNVKVNLPHLRERLIGSGYLSEEDSCSIEDVKSMLRKRFSAIDYKQAREDVMPFIQDPKTLDLWSEEFFDQITDMLQERSE